MTQKLLGQVFQSQLDVTLQHPEVLMTCDSCHLHHAQTFLEETRYRLMSEVVKPQVGDVA
jgi:hypothetical protein